VAPILIVWFGVGILPKVMIIAIFSFFPVLVNTLSGLQATGRQMISLMDTVAASQWQIYRYVRIPMALPHVFAGVRLAAAASVVGAIVVEWVSSTAGLGYLLILFQSRLNVSRAFATLIVLLLLGLLIFSLFAWIDRRFSWQRRLGIE
jgi:NitT/TauT family transport system permease protein